VRDYTHIYVLCLHTRIQTYAVQPRHEKKLRQYLCERCSSDDVDATENVKASTNIRTQEDGDSARDSSDHLRGGDVCVPPNNTVMYDRQGVPTSAHAPGAQQKQSSMSVSIQEQSSMSVSIQEHAAPDHARADMQNRRAKGASELPRAGVPPFAWVDHGGDDDDQHKSNGHPHHLVAGVNSGERGNGANGKDSAGQRGEDRDKNVDIATLAKHVKEMRKYFKAYGMVYSVCELTFSAKCFDAYMYV
jgi:hypothetical protein